MAAEVLVGTAIMVVLAIAVLVVATRGRGWYGYTPQTSREDVGWTPRTSTSSGPALLSRPITWMVAFFAVTGLGIVGVFLFATGSLGGTTVLLGAVGALVLVYLVGGVYLVARQRGHSNAMAVMESATASGAVFVLLIVVQLVAMG